MKKVLLSIILIVLLPVVIHAKINMSFNQSLAYVNDYIQDFDSYEAYLVGDESKYFCNIVSGKLLCSDRSGFNTGGFLNLAEFQLSGGQSSYLYDAGNTFTMTDYDVNNVYITTSVNNATNGYKSVSKSSSSAGMKVTQYIQEYMTVKGKGTYLDPWTFNIPEEWTYNPDINFLVTNETEIIGLEGWFTKPANIKLTTALPVAALVDYKYCVSNNGECDPITNGTNINNSTSLEKTIDNEGNNNKICAYIRTIVGKEITKCSPAYKVDTIAPTCKVVVSGSNFEISNIVENNSKLAAHPYSWKSSNASDFGDTLTKAAGEEIAYTAWVKDKAGNVGSCSAMTCTSWTPSTTGTGNCEVSLTATSKTTCSTANTYTCRVAATSVPKTSSYAASVENHVYKRCQASTSTRIRCSGTHGGTWAPGCVSKSSCGTQKYCVYRCTSDYMCGGSVSSSSTCSSTTYEDYCAVGSLSGGYCYQYNQQDCSGSWSVYSTNTVSSYSNFTRTCTNNN